jgi:GxxExxY protein
MRSEIYKDEGYKLMGAAFEVYNERGYGLGEEIYQECMEIELELRGIPFQAKRALNCFYKGRELKKCYIPDLYVFGCIITELKAVSQLLPEHESQLVNYLRLTRQPVGYLVNFGNRVELEWKRIIFSEFVSTPRLAAISED